MNLTIDRVDTYQRFLELEKPWELLLAKQPQPDFFLSHLWMTTLLGHFGEGITLNCLLLKDNSGNLQGIAPLILVNERRRGLPLLVLRFVSDPKLDMQRCDFMFYEDPNNGMRAFIEYLASHYQAWDVIDLSGFRSDSPYLSLLEAMAKESGLHVSARTENQISRVLFIDTDWNTYLQARKGHFLRRVSHERKRLDALGTVSFSCYRSKTDIAAGMDKVLPILFSRLEARTLNEVNPVDRSLIVFTQNLVERLSKLDACQIMLLEVNDQPIACLLSFVRDGVLYPFLTKYDPAFEKASPGRALFMHFIEDAFKQHYREIDFLSSWDYLSRFTPHTRQYVGLTIYHQGFFSRIARLEKQLLTPLFRRLIKAIRNTNPK